jgi:WD40 repeat protein
MSQDYNEAIQDASCFLDPELAQAEVVTNALGLPIPCSGNFADVYAVTNGQRKWAVKCFTREIPGLAERYVQISSALSRVQLPFMVEFKFLPQGIRVRGQWYPILKMHWVEGFSLNTFVKNNLDKPAVLQTLCQIWVKLAARLRETGMAHGDLQHGNIMLVPGSKAGALSVRLVDYDGMFVPALELLKTVEVGHANYQHPQRQRDGLYSIHIDPFPHLVIYTALRGVIAGGKALWEKYDNGDNMLFKQSDLVAPMGSPLFQELTQSSDKELRRMANVLLAAAQKPLEQTPLLEKLVAPPPPTTKFQAAVPAPAAVTAVTPLASNAFAGVADDSGPVSRMGRKKAGSGGMVMAGVAVLGMLVAGGGVAAFLVLNNLKKDDGGVALQKDTPGQPVQAAPSSKAGPSENRTPLPPSSKVDTAVRPPDPVAPAPPPAGNTFSVTSVADVTTAPGEEAKLEVVFERMGPVGAIVANVDGLPKEWKPTAPPEFMGKKMILRIPVPADAEDATRRATVILHLGDEIARGECSFTVKKRPPVISKGAKEIRAYEGANDQVTGVSVSPDGRMVLAGSVDRVARLWDVDSGNLLRTFNHKKAIHHVAFSPDGKVVLTGGEDGSVRFWDTKSGEETSHFETGRPGFFSHGASFSPDGRIVAIACDSSIYVVDVARGELVRKLSAHKKGATCAAFLPDGKQLLSVGLEDAAARLWDIESGKEIRSFDIGKFGSLSVAVSPDGRLGLTGGIEVRVIDLATGESRTLAGINGGILCVGFSRDGTRAIGCSVSSGIYVWEVASGRLLVEKAGFNTSLNGVEFTPTGDRALTAQVNRTVHLWDLGLPPIGSVRQVPPPVVAEGPKTAKEVRRYDGPTDAVVDLTLSPDGKTLLAGGTDGKLRFWDWESGQLTQTIDQTKDFGKSLIQHVHYSADGRQVVCSSAGDNVLRLWAATGEPVRRLDKLNNQDAVFSPDGQLLCVSTGTGPIRLIKATGEPVQILTGHRGASLGVVFHPDGKTILSCAGDKTARLWDVESGKEFRAIEMPRPIRSIALSPNGRLGLAGLDDGSVRAFDLESGDLRQVFSGHQEGSVIWSVRFSRDGSRAISACHDGTFRVWEVATGRELAVSPAQGKPVGGAIFTPAGDQAISCGWDGTVRLWDLGLPAVGPAPEVVRLTRPEKPLAIAQVEPRYTLRTGSAIAAQAVVAADGHSLFSHCRGVVHRYDLADSAKETDVVVKVATLTVHMGHSVDGKRAVTLDAERIVRLWDTETGKELGNLQTDWKTLPRVEVSSADLKMIALDKEVTVWDLGKHRALPPLDIKDAQHLALTADGKRLAYATAGGDRNFITILDVTRNKPVKQLPIPHGGCLGFQFSPDGSALAYATLGTIHVWETKTWKDTAEISSQGSLWTSICFSPDGKRLASLTQNRDQPTARVWDVAKGTELLNLNGHKGMRGEIFWSLDGKTIVAGGDSAIWVWDAPK